MFVIVSMVYTPRAAEFFMNLHVAGLITTSMRLGGTSTPKARQSGQKRFLNAVDDRSISVVLSSQMMQPQHICCGACRSGFVVMSAEFGARFSMLADTGSSSRLNT